MIVLLLLTLRKTFIIWKNVLFIVLKEFEFTVSTQRTGILYINDQPSMINDQTRSNFKMDNVYPNNQNNFTYLRSCISRHDTLNKEIPCKLAIDSSSFEQILKRVWQEYGTTWQTMVAVYKAVVLSSLLYGRESWTRHSHHIKKMNQFYLCCLHSLLSIQ